MATDLKLRDIREKAGVSIRELSAKTGFDRSYISRIERNVVTPSEKFISKAARVLKLSKEEIELLYGRLPEDIKTIFYVHPLEAASVLRETFVGYDTTTLEQETEKNISAQRKITSFFEKKNVVIYNDDILTTTTIEPATVDLIVTSPPYNVDIQYGTYDDRMTYSDYLQFTRAWLRQCYSFAKNDGRLCLNVPLDKNKGGQQSVCADITTIAKQVGWQYHSTIIWNEQNISRRTAWGSWLSASAPYVIAPVEVIIIFYKKHWRKLHKGKSDITRQEFMDWTNGVWTFCGESKKRIGHPAPFPVELPRRCIKLFSYVDDLILDPFLGSGTTLRACLETKRRGIGVEVDENYCQLAKKRVTAYDGPQLNMNFDKERRN